MKRSFVIVALLAGVFALGSLFPIVRLSKAQGQGRGHDPEPVQIVAPLPVPVAATQSGTWSVGLQGSPSIKDADQPARNFINMEFATGYAESYTVPAGKILVIEWICNGSGSLAANALLGLRLDGDTGPNSDTHRWSAIFTPRNGFVYENVRLYAKAGQTVRINSLQGFPVQFYAQGYLLDE